MSFNTSNGIVRCPELKRLNDNEIRENLKQEGVLHVRRFNVKRNGTVFPTNTFIFFFNVPKQPDYVRVGFHRCKVDTYILNRLRCYHCQQYGHHESRCNRDPVYGNCAEKVAHNAERCANHTKCANCGQDHKASSKECKLWHRGKELLRIIYSRNIIFLGARKIVDSQTVDNTQSYASIAGSNSQSVKLSVLKHRPRL